MSLDQDASDLENELLAALEEYTDDAANGKKLQHILAAAPAGRGVLGSLSDTALWRILCCLSAEDLCSLSCCSKFWKNIANDSALWSRLYLWRWPGGHKFDNQEDDQENQDLEWKKLYMQRDTSELVEALQNSSELLQPFYLQMSKAKRSQSLGLSQADSVFAAHESTTSNSISGRVAKFRKQHGLDVDSPQKNKHCADDKCKFVQLEGTVYICEKCGMLHKCGDVCREYIVERGSNLHVCPISGRCFHRLMSEAEENADTGPANNEDAAGDDWNVEQHVGGRLGRAFFAGYNAADEKEMLIKFGVRL